MGAQHYIYYVCARQIVVALLQLELGTMGPNFFWSLFRNTYLCSIIFTLDLGWMFLKNRSLNSFKFFLARKKLSNFAKLPFFYYKIEENTNFAKLPSAKWPFFVLMEFLSLKFWKIAQLFIVSAYLRRLRDLFFQKNLALNEIVSFF